MSLASLIRQALGAIPSIICGSPDPPAAATQRSRRWSRTWQPRPAGQAAAVRMPIPSAAAAPLPPPWPPSAEGLSSPQPRAAEGRPPPPGAAARSRSRSPSRSAAEASSSPSAVAATPIAPSPATWRPVVRNAPYLVQRGQLAWEFFMDHGFVVLDLGLDAEGKTAFANLARHMGRMAVNPELRGNRGPGRTCVNDTANIQNNMWREALKIIMGHRDVKIVLSELVLMLKLRFHDCGGDYIEADAVDIDIDGSRNPCRWHRDHTLYLQWFCISVLAEPTSIQQAPLVLESWSECKGRVQFIGQPGLCVIRDVFALHRGSANNAHLPRAMPSFRFGAGNAVKLSSSMSVPELCSFLGA